MLADGSGNNMTFNNVNGLSQVITNLQKSVNYRVTVRAFTVGAGPQASIIVVADAKSKGLCFSLGRSTWTDMCLLCCIKHQVHLVMCRVQV